MTLWQCIWKTILRGRVALVRRRIYLIMMVMAPIIGAHP